MASSPHEPDREARIAPISVAAVRRLFSRPQRCVDSRFLRREIAARMFERLGLIRLSPRSLLDAGCGEGQDLLGLQQAYPAAQLLAVDASTAMLAEARASVVNSRSSLQQLMSRILGVRAATQHAASLACADFARLPLPPASIDFVWSNLALHWHPQPHKVLQEWARVLRTDGLLMFSAFGPDTFKELREAFEVSGLGDRVLPFVDLHDYGDMLVSAGMATPVMDMEKLTLTYASTARLFADVRAIGGNPLIDAPRGLASPRRWRRLEKALDDRRDADGNIRLTIEVSYGHAFRAAPRKTAAGDAILHFEPRPR
jgi:malonyl-CoA O-methyltransferase